MTAERPVAVSVVIAAHNEAANIEACIASVRWAQEILVVEDGSTDDTVERATAAGATVISNPFVTIGQQRNAAIERAASGWILVVDADERASTELGREVETAIAANDHDAFRLPRRNFFLGSEIRHGGWDRDRPVRLFRATLRYNASRVHEHVETTGSVGDLTAPLTHEPYPSIDSYFEKLDRYSQWWAEDRRGKGRTATAANVVIRPPLRFLTMYLLKGGWMDGAPGAVLASLAATSVMSKYVRLWAMGRKDKD